jgi:uncharacterized protein
MTFDSQTPNDPLSPAAPPMPDAASTLPAAAAPAPAGPSLIAPWWHTAIIVILILANSFTGSSKLGAVQTSGSRILLYSGTFIIQSILILIIWFGIRSRGVRIRDLIGGRWDTVEKFLIDVAVASGFWIISIALLAGLRIALGTVDLHNLAKTKDDTLRILGPLAPHTYLEAGLFVLLSVCAGLFEEIIFRGYLQRQFITLSKNAAVGIAISAIIFGLAHAYQGPRLMAVIAVYGSMFGILAHFWKNLRPGMMAHTFQDVLSGISLFFLVRH